MNITVNGETCQCKESITVEELVAEKNFPVGKIAVEVNETIVPKSKYGEFHLSESDTMEVVTFVGGG